MGGSALEEAAVSIWCNQLCELISFQPSDWLLSPLPVMLDGSQIDVPNWWTEEAVTARVNDFISITNWDELELACRSDFVELTILQDAFTPLRRQPYSPAVVDRVRVLLSILNRMKTAFEDTGARKASWHEDFQKFFTGKNALFSDSSISEKARCKDELTFVVEANPRKTELCSWHGKIRTQTLRLHFSWPMTADSPLYIVYVGPKLTKT